MTGRGWTAHQPDETPVEVLPLRPGTINVLRSGGVLTLGELRAMGDHELLPLRRFGPVALAEVRFLVPPPGGSVGEEVTIAGRAFTLGVVYGPLPRTYGQRAHRLLGHVADSPLPGGRVTVAVLPSGRRETMAGAA